MTNPYQPTPPQPPDFGRRTPPPPPSPSAPYFPPPKKSNSNALVSMILGIAGLVILPIGLVLGPIAIVFSRIAIKQIDARNENGESYARAGIITGMIATVIGALVVAFYASLFAFLWNDPFSELGNIDNQYDEERTILNMNSLADDLDEFLADNSRLPGDSQMLNGEVINESLINEINASKKYSSVRRSDFQDGWDRQIVYDRLTDPIGADGINAEFGYDKEILKKANPDIKAGFILWSKGVDPNDPNDDIFFIKGRGIVRPDGYQPPKDED